MPNLLSSVLDAILSCASQLEEKPDSQRDAHSERSSTKGLIVSLLFFLWYIFIIIILIVVFDRSAINWLSVVAVFLNDFGVFV